MTISENSFLLMSLPESGAPGGIRTPDLLVRSSPGHFLIVSDNSRLLCFISDLSRIDRTPRTKKIISKLTKLWRPVSVSTVFRGARLEGFLPAQSFRSAERFLHCTCGVERVGGSCQLGLRGCSAKNSHITFVALISSIVRPKTHSAMCLPPGQVWPPPSIVYSTTSAFSAQFA